MEKTAIFTGFDAFYDNCLGSPLTPGCQPVGARPPTDPEVDAALKCRSCRTPRHSPPVHIIRLTKELQFPDDFFGGKLSVRL
jgi:hypothetical protein